MADDTLQFRSDTLDRWQSATAPPFSAEPMLISDEERMVIGRKDRGRGGHPLMGNPLREGLQHKVLWAMGRWGNAPGVAIPALGGAAAYDLTKGYAFTGSFMEDELVDSVGVEIWADGHYLADSPDPRLTFDLAFGPDLPGPGVIRPTGGACEISYRRLGANCLGYDYEERLGWHLHLFVHFFGHDGIGKIAVNDTVGRIRVTGEMRWGPIAKSTDGFGSSAGPAISGLSNVWRDNLDYTAGAELVHGPYAVRAIGDVAGASTFPASATTADQVSWLVSRSSVRDDREPGFGNRWREWWYRRNQIMPICWEYPATLTGLGNSLSLRFAGPYQSDTGLSVDIWDGTGSGNWDPLSANDANRVVIDGAGFFTPRFTFPKNGAPEPSTSPRHWRQMSFFRRDEMIVNSSVAVVHGGRVGVADRNFL